MPVTVSCSSSPPEPASMCGSPVGYRSGPGETHDADLHRLLEEGGDQTQDDCAVVLHAKHRWHHRGKDCCRLLLPSCIWHDMCAHTKCIYVIYVCMPFLSARYTSMRVNPRLSWMDHLRAVWPGKGARTCKTSPSKSKMSPSTTVASTSASYFESLSLTSSLRQSPSPRTSSWGWKRKVRLIVFHFLICFSTLPVLSLSQMLGRCVSTAHC